MSDGSQSLSSSTSEIPADKSLRGRPKFDRPVSLLCWAYNEELLMEGFLKRSEELMDSCVEDYEILVIDDCSTDATNSIIIKAIENNPRIRMIRNETNRNVGYCMKLAVQSARKEFLFWQTADWSYNITNLRDYLELLRKYDVVAGVRRAPVKCKAGFFKPFFLFLQLFGMKHITRRSDTVGKAFVSICNYILLRLLYRVPLSDFQNVVFYRSSLVQSLDLVANSAFANPEMLIKSYWAGASMAEVPISFIPRTLGEAKGTKFAAVKAAVKDVIGHWWSWVVLGQVNKTPGSVRRLVPSEWPSEMERPRTS